MKKCWYCQSELIDNAKFCKNCGREQKETKVQPSFPEMNNSPEKKNSSEINLWTWIKGGKSNKALYENDKVNVDKEEFLNVFAKKLKEKEIPVSLKKVEVNWNEGKQKSSECKVELKDEKLNNPISMLIQFEKVGKYTFVGDNTFITPPVLPEVPGEKVNVPEQTGAMFYIVGILIFVLASMFGGYEGPSTMSVFCALALIGIGAFYTYRRTSAISHNDDVKLQEIAWDAAWKKWHDEQVEYTFQQRSSGKLDCILSAVVRVLQETAKELFTVDPVMEDTEEISQKELEEAIALRRQALE